jgi:hypothetical protein
VTGPTRLIASAPVETEDEGSILPYKPSYSRVTTDRGSRWRFYGDVVPGGVKAVKKAMMLHDGRYRARQDVACTTTRGLEALYYSSQSGNQGDASRILRSGHGVLKPAHGSQSNTQFSKRPPCDCMRSAAIGTLLTVFGLLHAPASCANKKLKQDRQS